MCVLVMCSKSAALSKNLRAERPASTGAVHFTWSGGATTQHFEAGLPDP